jgi:hypothetical protein
MNNFVQKTRMSNRQADGIRYSIFFVISIFPAASGVTKGPLQLVTILAKRFGIRSTVVVDYYSTVHTVQ